MKHERIPSPARRAAAWAAAAILTAALWPAIARDTGGDRAPATSKDMATPARPLTSNEQVAEQLAGSFDVGDFYLTPSGPRPLHRLAGSVAVRFKPQVSRREGLQKLSGTNGPLQRYRPSLESVKGVTILQAPRGVTSREQGDPRLFSESLGKVRSLTQVHSANPVFVEPGTGLARVTTDEILISLRPGVDPRAYFGADWTSVRPLRGATEVFVLTRPAVTVEALLDEANRHAGDPRAAWAQPNFVSQVIKQTADPLFSAQWSFHNTGLNGATAGADVNALEAWNRSVGRPEIVIAILDDGVQMSHPDLATNISSNAGELLNPLDDDGNGYTNDFSGWDFFRDDNAPNPEFASDNHGTAVAGVAAAAANNGLGGAGIAYRCRVMPVKILGGDNWVPDSTLAEAIYYAAGRTRNGLATWRGADVINLSLSFPQSAVVDGALAWAAANGRGGRGCPIFAAAGDQASRWLPARVRLPVGATLGPGSFRFGFEYSKDVSDTVGEDLIRLDNVALVGPDGTTVVNSALGSAGRQDFEGTFPPSGWQSATSIGAQPWNATMNGALTGTRGGKSAQSGALGDNLFTELRTPPVTLAGGEFLTFSCYTSSEIDYDGLRVWVYTASGDYITVFEGPMSAPLVSGNIALTNSIQYPASHPNVIAVGASTDADVRADYSAHGSGLELVAPSSGGWSDIPTTDRTGADGYAAGDYALNFGGTSAASPLAAGIGALMLSINPAMTVTELRTLLRDACEKIGGVTYDAGGWNQFYGFGRLNAQHAVESVVSPFSATITSPANGSMLLAGAATTITATASSLESTIARVEFFAGATKIGEDTTAPYSINWANPALGTVALTARAVDARGSNVVSAPVSVTFAPGLTVSDATVTEGNRGTTNLTFNVRLSARSTETVMVNFTSDNGSAIGGVDFVPTSGTLVFPPGTTNLVVRVPVIGNLLSETNRTLLLNLSQPVNAALARAQAVGVIVDNRDPLPTVVIEDVTVAEADSGTMLANFDVQLSTRSGQAVTVGYFTANGTGAAGLDYQAMSGTVTFLPGVLNQTISIPVPGDTWSESNKTFFVNLTNAAGATIARRQARGTILDNDTDPLVMITDASANEGHAGTNSQTFTVHLSNRSGKPITVNYAAASGTALAGGDFVGTRGSLRFAPGTTNQTLRVTVLGDTTSESNETFFVNLTTALNAHIFDPQGVGTILDDDALPGLSITDVRGTEADAGSRVSLLTVRLSVASGRTVAVAYATADGTATAGSDYSATNGTLTFPPGTTIQTIRVAVIGNTVSESNETFLVNLSNPTNATLFDGQAVATILDNDRLPALFVNDITVAERSGQPTNAVFTVRLSALSGRTVTVRYTTSNGTAVANTEFNPTNGFLTFPPGVTNRPLTVTLRGNPPAQASKIFSVNLSNPTNATLGDPRGLCTLRADNAPFNVAAAPPPDPIGPTSGVDPGFRITAARVQGPDVLISFTTVVGRASSVEYSDGLNGPATAWLPLPGATEVPGTGTVVTVTDVGGSKRAYRFYRIRVLP